jgi:hypothetical protein
MTRTKSAGLSTGSYPWPCAALAAGASRNPATPVAMAAPAAIMWLCLIEGSLRSASPMAGIMAGDW